MILPSTFFQDLLTADYWHNHGTTIVITLFLISALTCYACRKPKAQSLPPGPPGPQSSGISYHWTQTSTLTSPAWPRPTAQFSSSNSQQARHRADFTGRGRQVLKDHDTVFANRDVLAAGRVSSYGGSDIVWNPYGPEWRMLRKVCVLKMLSNTTLDSVYNLRRKEMRKTVAHLHEPAGSPVNVGEQGFRTVMNVVTNMMWGGAVEGAERERLAVEFRELASEMTLLLGKPNVSDFFPSWHGSICKRSDEGQEKKDFLQFLLNLKEEASGDDSKTPFTITHVKALLIDMVVGGTDTSSNTIEFAMAEILRKPEVMKKVQEELESVIGKDNMVEESHIHKLPYLQAVMKETLRLHPTVPLMVPHCPSETTTVGGYTIPKGSRVFVNVWAIHRDPSIWEQPLEFDPSRFLDTKWDFSGKDFNYFPFGSGRRICAGILMAERTVLYFLATLLHTFDWTIPQNEKLDVSEKFGIILKMKTPLLAIPTPRISIPDFYKQS
ncbi:hypothetical protein Fmac_026021 [Flemingia macrophylla]|uniref:Cytochrome P450 n=1 Tax=Flemingia macrophylla TaxID=520843 RepID=A0ABD1LDN6_9FABA